jgi:hypothetical protein
MNLSEVIADFCGRLHEAGIPYLVGGSVASGIWGSPRQTNDVDLEIWVNPGTLATFISACAPPYEVSLHEATEAVLSKDEFRSIQVMHGEELLRFDCFLQGFSPIDEDAYDRSVEVELLPGIQIRVACAEHILVQKLRWFELGRQVSERQWRDIQGIIANSPHLDWKLIHNWSGALNLEELAQKAQALATN